MNTKEIVKALIDDIAVSFEYDVTTGMVEKDVISPKGVNYSKKAGIKAPHSFDSLADFYFSDDSVCRIIDNSKIKELNNTVILDYFCSGKKRCEINFLYKGTNEYYRAIFFIYMDDKTEHIKAFVVCRSIIEIENELFSSSGYIKSERQRENEVFYKNILDTQSCGILAYSLPKYKIIAANSETLRMFGYKDVNELQDNILDLVTRIYYPDENTKYKLIDLRVNDGEVDYDCYFNKDSDKELYVIAKSKTVRSPSGRRIIYTTYVDATEMRMLNESRQKAELGVKAKSDFLFNISHDIRTPMNAIIGYAELLQEGKGTPEKNKKYLDKLVSSSKFLMHLLDNAIDLASFKRGEAILKESLGNAIRFNEMLDAAIESELQNKNISFSRTVNIQHENVMCDINMLRSVFFNVLSNSIKYTGTGGFISMDLEETTSSKEGYAMFKTVITDNGIGISKEFLPYVFDEFSREKNTTVSGIAGAGIGLSISKKMVELMGGTISIESTEGIGTKVTIIIPHKIVENEELKMHSKEGFLIDKGFICKKRLLIVEDNDINAEIACVMLTDEGFMCERVSDGIEAVNSVQNHPDDYFDAILMDIQMPVMDGYKATQIIRQMDGVRSKIPIIATTANALEEDKRMSFDSGMDGHVAKPIDLVELLNTLYKVLKKKENI